MTESVPLACENPSFPPLQIRNLVLHGCKEANLITWVEHLGGKAASKEAAIEYILRTEYGDQRIDEFVARMTAAQEAHEARLREAHQREKEALAKYEAAHYTSHLDLEADAKERAAQRSGPPASPLTFRGPLPEEK